MIQYSILAYDITITNMILYKSDEKAVIGLGTKNTRSNATSVIELKKLIRFERNSI